MSTENQLPPWAMISHLAYALKLDEAQCEQIGKLVAQWQKDMFVCASLFAKCESPIERMFLLGCQLNGTRAVFREEKYGAAICDVKDSDHQLWVRPQVEIVDWESEDCEPLARVDFELTLVGSRSYRLCIECDGHDYHDRTKEQAAKDKARDRKIVGLGNRIMRFTGSEIFAGAVKCFNEAVDGLLRIEREDQEDLARTESEHYGQGFAEGYARRGQSITCLADNVLNARDWAAVVPLLRAHGFGVDYTGKFQRALLIATDHPDLLAAIRLQLERLPKPLENECEPASQ